MDSRERTFLALRHQAGDRIPIDFWASNSMKKRLAQATGASFDDFLDNHDVDLRYIAGPEYIGPPIEEGKDIWGVLRRAVEVETREGVETYSEVAHSPLAEARSLEEIEDYPGWPSPDWFDYRVVEAQCDAIRERGRVAVFMGDRLNRVAQLKPAMYLRGMENILMDVMTEEAIARAIFGKIREFCLAYLERILEAANGKIDIVLTGDDFGAQKGTLIAPDAWRRLLKPGFAEYLRTIQDHNTTSMHHTCGSVVAILPDFIECGLNVLQSLQPEATNMSLTNLKAKFGEKLCFHGGVSIQRTMPFCAPEDIRREIQRIAETVKPDGGYIFCTSHNIQTDTSLENVAALLGAYREFGVY